MSFLQDKIVNYAYVAKAQTTSLRPGSGVKITRNNLPEGTVALTDLENKVITSLPATGKFKIAYKGTNNDIMWSAPIDVANVTLTSQDAIEDLEKIVFLGYNGSTGSFPTTASTSYHVGVTRRENSKSRRGLGFDMDFMGQYYNPATGASQSLWAFGMQNTLLGSLELCEQEIAPQGTPSYARIEVVGDGTVADFTGTATMVKVTKGSKQVEFVTAALAASTGTVAANDIFNIPSTLGRTFTFTASALGTGAGNHVITIGETSYTVADAGTADQNATAIAAAINAGTQARASASTSTVTIEYNPCTIALPPTVFDSNGSSFIAVTIVSGNAVANKYKVKASVSAGASFLLTQAYQGETGYIVGGTTAATMAGIATVTNYGIRISGVRNDYDVYRWRDYYKNDFKVVVRSEDEQATDVLVTESQNPRLGHGQFPQVAQSEYVSYGNFGRNRMVTDMPPIHRPTLADDCLQYALVQMSDKNVVNPTLVGGVGVFDSQHSFWLELPNSGTLASGSQGDQLAETLLGAGFTTGDFDL